MPAETLANRPVLPQLHLLAKAPLAGQAKTRLAPLLGNQGAANAHAELLRHCVANACQALPAENVTLWTALDHAHPLFIELHEQFGLTLKRQPDGDLGARVRHALNHTPGPAMVMGSDCPGLFESIPWGSHQVLSATRQRIEALGLRAAYPATIWDVDRPEDWQRWKEVAAAL